VSLKRKGQTVKTVEVAPYQRTYTLTEMKCPICGNTFTGQQRAVYDSVACRQKANYQRNGEAYRESRMKSYRKAKEKDR